jgi:hypothetical protein
MGMAHGCCYGPGSVSTFFEFFIKGIFVIWGTLKIFNRLKGTLMQSLAWGRHCKLGVSLKGCIYFF